MSVTDNSQDSQGTHQTSTSSQIDIVDSQDQIASPDLSPRRPPAKRQRQYRSPTPDSQSTGLISTPNDSQETEPVFSSPRARGRPRQEPEDLGQDMGDYDDDPGSDDPEDDNIQRLWHVVHGRLIEDQVSDNDEDDIIAGDDAHFDGEEDYDDDNNLEYNLDDWMAQLASEELVEEHETIAQMLEESEHLDLLKMASWKIRHNATRESANHLRLLFADRLDLPSEYQMMKHLQTWSGLRPIVYDCCFNSCVCYHDPRYADLEECPHCNEPRYHPNTQKPRKTYTHIPLIPQLLARFRNPEYVRLASYRHNYERDDESIHDIFDSNHYQNLLKTKVWTVNEDGSVKKANFNHFHERRDVALAVFSDGFQLFKKSRVQKAATPFLLLDLNLPPHVRVHSEWLLRCGVIPGPHNPWDPNSFFYPIFDELSDLAFGVEAFDATEQQMFQLHAYVILKGADLVAMAKFLQQKGAGAISGCGRCEAHGVRIQNQPLPPQRPNNTYYTPVIAPTTHRGANR